MKNQIEQYFDRLFPLNRSLTGNGVRETFSILSELVDFKITEVPTGTKALDWTIPKEWNVNEAYILTPDGRKIADFSVNNLYLMGYSIPFSGKINFETLKKHITTRPDFPDAIPYVTSYYVERWGFCLSHDEFLTLPEEGEYYVKIDTTLEDGFMTVGEVVLPGETDEEILFTSYCCHPSMANNELSGILALTFLYQQLKQETKRKYTYRFYLAPETIGAIYYLSQNGQHFKEKLKGGVVITCCGDKGQFTLKKSRSESYFNSVLKNILDNKTKGNYKELDFFPMGSDERQYCSPGFDLPMVCLTRTMYGEYKEYHTSKDDKSVIDFSALEEYVLLVKELVDSIELDGNYINQSPFGEPQLGKRGLYPTLMKIEDRGESLKRLLYLLNYSDGKHSLLDISNIMKTSIVSFRNEIEALQEKELLKKASDV
jgi:aminopeptidase-like protein